MRISVISAALVASLVGFGSTIALVLAAATALNATPAQTASWLLAVSLAKAIGSAGLSVWFRVPVVLAWSTPGAALIAASSGVTMAQGVGAFLVAGGLIVLSGLITPLGRLVARIPDGIAAGMLAGVLVPFCLKLAPPATELPLLVLPIIATFLIVRLWNPAMAVLAGLIVAIALAFLTGSAIAPDLSAPFPTLTLIAPAFTLTTVIGLGIPLYLVTMASQNLPGFATMRAHGYTPPVGPALVTTGGLSMIAGLFGAHTVNMAAITAAICMGDDVHPDRARRWIVGPVYAAFWVCLGIASPFVIAVMAVLPGSLVAAIVGMALLGSLSGALATAFAVPAQRFAATVTFTVTASGVAAFGVGAAFWGLIAGLLVYGFETLRAKP